MKALVLSSSPRRNGNSALLAEAVRDGLTEAGHEATFLFAQDFLQGFLRDCRQCRKPDGECSIEDGFRSVFLDHYLTSDGFIAATPIYWYGTSAQLKAFLDRTFCYYAASYPKSEEVIEGMQGKRIGLVLSSEETFPMVSGAVICQIQEFSRYTRSNFVGVVHGYGNARGDVLRDPNDPIMAARRFGNEFFTRHTSDYQIDTVRSGRVWG
ncbi:MAG TPA: flavodoxin family protein [Methyloceanibacter sp.]|jgi:multimeric flavodoxin WrbA|nr:flavodoxin family protein [Methyloceanibacter sp.]